MFLKSKTTQPRSGYFYRILHRNEYYTTIHKNMAIRNTTKLKQKLNIWVYYFHKTKQKNPPIEHIFVT